MPGTRQAPPERQLRGTLLHLHCERGGLCSPPRAGPEGGSRSFGVLCPPAQTKPQAPRKLLSINPVAAHQSHLGSANSCQGPGPNPDQLNKNRSGVVKGFSSSPGASTVQPERRVPSPPSPRSPACCSQSISTSQSQHGPEGSSTHSLQALQREEKIKIQAFQGRKAR